MGASVRWSVRVAGDRPGPKGVGATRRRPETADARGSNIDLILPAPDRMAMT